MKKQILVRALVVLFTLFAGLKANSQVTTSINITSLPFGKQSVICFGDTTTSLKIRLENLVGDSILVNNFTITNSNNNFTIGDSIIVYRNGALLSRTKLISNSLNAPINIWVQGYQSDTFQFVCKTFNYVAGSFLTYLQGINFTRNSITSDFWVYASGPWLYTNDCSIFYGPYFYYGNSIYNNSTCQDSIINILNVSVQSYDRDSTLIKGLRLRLQNGYSGTVDSVYAYFNNLIIGKYKVVNNKVNIDNINRKIAYNTTSQLKFECKSSSQGGYSLVLDTVFWKYQNTDSSSSVGLYGNGYTQDCSLHVKINIYPNRENNYNFCKNDYVEADRSLQGVYEVIEEKWFLNGIDSDITSKSGVGNMNFKVPLNIPYVDLSVRVKDASGRTAYDSIRIIVHENPKPKVSASSSIICSGNPISITFDTTGFKKANTKWAAFGYQSSSNSPVKYWASQTGEYYCYITDSNGCSGDTTIRLQEVPVPAQAVIVPNGPVLGSNVSAYHYKWMRDTTFALIPNSNQMFISGTNSGFYTLEVSNEYGCSNRSATIYHAGYAYPDSMPHVKLVYSNLRIGKVCRRDSIWVMRQVTVTKTPIKTEKWYLNGILIPFSPNQLFDGMRYLLPLSLSQVKLLVEIEDTLGHIAKDSFILNVSPSPQINMTLTGNIFCQGGQIAGSVNTSGGRIAIWDLSPLNNLTTHTMNNGGIHYLTVTDTLGCSTDTSFLIKMSLLPNKPILSFINNTIFSNSMSIYKATWYKNADTIANEHTWKLNTTSSGIYTMKVTDSLGCSNISDNMSFDGYIFPDSMPHVNLILSNSKIGANACKEDNVSITFNFTKATSSIISKKIYQNGTLLNFAPSQIYDGMKYTLDLSQASGVVKVLCEVKDSMNHVAKDSITINVLSNPNIKLTVLNSSFCPENPAVAIIDTTGGSFLPGSKWDGSSNTSYLTQKTFTSSGDHSLRMTSINGCISEASFTTNALSTPEKPQAFTKDSMIWSNKFGDSMVWIMNGIPVANSNNQFIIGKQTGAYSVKVYQNKCASISDAILFIYTGPVVVIDSSSIKITTTDNFPYGSFCQGDFHPLLNMVGVNTNNIQSAIWYVNNQIVYECTNPSFKPIIPVSIPLDYGMKNVKVRMQMKSGQLLLDSMSFPVIFTANSKLGYNGSMCKDSIIHFYVNFTDGTTGIKWFDSSTKGTLDLMMTEQSRNVFAQISTSHGCLTFTDTISIQSIVVPTPALTTIKCDIYADMNSQQSGYYKWYKNYTLIDTTLDNHYKVSTPGYYQAQFKSAVSGCVSKFVSTFADCSTTGIDEINSDGVKVYPNPFADKIIIESKIGSKFVFIDINGRIIYEGSTKSQHEEFTIDAPPGIYIIEIKNGEKISHQKLVKE